MEEKPTFWLSNYAPKEEKPTFWLSGYAPFWEETTRLYLEGFSVSLLIFFFKLKLILTKCRK